jgi:hypothetical protein
MMKYLCQIIGGTASSGRIGKRRQWADTQMEFKKNAAPPMEKRPLKKLNAQARFPSQELS